MYFYFNIEAMPKN